MSTFAELLGMACLVACAYLIYEPAAFGVAGVLLILAANLHEVRKAAERKHDA